jgi:hypothetical protein
MHDSDTDRDVEAADRGSDRGPQSGKGGEGRPLVHRSKAVPLHRGEPRPLRTVDGEPNMDGRTTLLYPGATFMGQVT